MQNTSDAYKAILSKQHYDVRPRLTIAGDVYAGPIWDLSVNGGLFSSQTPSVGCCVSREIDLTIFPEYEIPRMAEIKVEVQLTITDILNGEVLEASEWLPKGTFFIDTRHEDKSSGALVIHGYDAMLKMEQMYLTDGDELTGWPKSMDVVATDIATLIGVEIDERTVLNAGYMVEAPVSYTMREVMGWIAAAHGGNWTITDVGKLRLLPLASIPTETYYLVDENGNYLVFGDDRILVKSVDAPTWEVPEGASKVWVGNAASSLEFAPKLAPFTGVTVWYDDELAYQSGDASGRLLELDCPWATQEMADNILAAITGYVYQPYSATGALLDPAAELGDGVTVGGVYSVLASIATTFDALCASDISAPGDEEVDHEYPYESPTNRELKRKVTLGRDYFGAKISKAKGIEITKTSEDGTQKSRAIFNSDVFAMYNDDGAEALYFDSNAGKFKFTGLLNVADNFIVDKDGNLTINGNINLSGGTITWGDNKPSGGISSGQARTIIREELVSSPNIMGANYWSADENTWMNLLDASETSVGIGGGIEVEASGITIFSAIKDAYLNAVLSAYNTDFLMVTNTGTIHPRGKWDFQFANVTGLDGVGGGDVTVTPVWG